MDAPKAYNGMPYGWVGLTYAWKLEAPEGGIESGGNGRSSHFDEEAIAPQLAKILWRQGKSRVDSWVGQVAL
jgi:hypothetical protein